MTEQFNISETPSGESWIFDKNMFGETYTSDGLPTSFDPFDVYRNGENGDPYSSLVNDRWDEWYVLGAAIALEATRSAEQLEEVMDREFDRRIDAELEPYNQGDGDEGFWDAECGTYEQLSDDELLRILQGTGTTKEGVE